MYCKLQHTGTPQICPVTSALQMTWCQSVLPQVRGFSVPLGATYVFSLCHFQLLFGLPLQHQQ